MIYSWDTESVFSNETGTGWTLDVTAANLSTRLDEKDFVVAFDGVLIDNTQFTKLTPTAVRYDGTATGGVFVEFRRNTGVNPFRLATYTDVILSGDYNRNFERVSRKLAELDEFGAGEPGEVSIVDAAFAPGWSADSVNGASRAALFAKFEAETQAYTEAIQALDDDLQPQIDTKAPLDSPNLTGSPTAPTPPLANNSTRLATTGHVQGNLAQYTNTTDLNLALDLKAPLDSPTLTGTPTAPTATSGTNTTQIATTAFVQAATPAPPRAVLLADVKSAGVGGGTSVEGWQTRTLNTVTGDTSLVSLSDNQFTLPAGTYYAQFYGGVSGVNAHQVALRNVTDSELLLGQTSSTFASGTSTSSTSVGSAVFTISDTKTFELRQYTASATPNGLGVPPNTGGPNVHAQVSILKIA